MNLLQGITSRESWNSTEDVVVRAPLTIFEYIKGAHQNYSVYVVEYGHSYNHVYLLQSDGDISPESFENALKLSHSPEGMLSYWDIKTAGSWSSIFDH
jgi:hypothetical protein